MRKIKRWIWTVACGFLVLYFVVMGACTYLLCQKNMTEFEYAFDLKYNQISNGLEGININTRWTEKECLAYYQKLLSENMTAASKYQQFSGMLYDETSAQAVQSSSGICIDFTYALADLKGKKAVYYYALCDLLSESEMEMLAQFMLEGAQSETGAENYRLIAEITDDYQLNTLLLQKIYWEKYEGEEGERDPFDGTLHSYQIPVGKFETEDYVQVASEVVWEWENPARGEGKTQAQRVVAYFPCGTYGTEAWRRWQKSAFLQNLIPDDREEEYYSEAGKKVAASTEATFKPCYRVDTRIMLDDSGDRMGYLTLASECRPWTAAMEELKYVYLAGFFLTCICACTVIFVFYREARQQAQIEANRRDFTDAMAHKMKTPLGVIRGFAENLQENTVEEKREYYLEQIICQTEEMDDMVAEMLSAVKLDSSKVLLQREKVSVNKLLREQFEKFQPLIGEMGLTAEVSEQGEFELVGDRKYLEKAFWNLLDNAIRYNIRNGRIEVRIWESGCRIENSCVLREKDAGIGQYLTEKILKLHHMNMKVKKMPDRFAVTCRMEK